MAIKESIGPLALMEHEGGQYSLVLSDLDYRAEVFEEKDHEPSGYAWEGVVQLLLQERAPELADRVEFDSEAGMFCAYGTDAAALRTVAGLVQETLDDPAKLAAAIDRADAADLMDD